MDRPDNKFYNNKLGIRKNTALSKKIGMGMIMRKTYRGKKQICTAFIVVALLMICVGRVQDFEVKAAERTVRVGVFELNGFFGRDDQGELVGYGADYLQKLSEKTGWNFTYVWAENWDESVAYLREGKVDMIAPAQKTEARMQEFGFSSYSIGMECGTLLTLSTNEKLVYEDFSSFGQIQIGCVDTLVFQDAFLSYAKDKGFTPSIVYYKDTKAVLAALKAGEIDAALTNLFAKTETTKVLAKFGMAPFFLMTRQGDDAFIRELDEALQQIKIEFIEFETDLMDQYYPDFNNVPFTKDELNYIESAPVFNVACRTNIKPISYEDEKTGEMRGITRDILDEISSISGLRFAYVPIPEGNVTYDFFRENDISLISSVEYNKENINAPGISLTNPYLDSKKVFVCKQDFYFEPDGELRLAVATGSQTLAQAIGDHYPSFSVLVYDSIEECFEAVKKGQADALLQNQYVVTNYLARPRYMDMTTIPVEDFDDQLCLSPVVYQEAGVADPLLSDARLLSILNKSIRQISEDDLAKIIIRQTTEGQYQYTISDFVYQNRYLLSVLGIVLGVLLLICLHVIHIKHRSNLLIAENEAKLRYISNNINGGVVVLSGDEMLKIAYANKGFLELLDCGKEAYEEIKNQEYSTYVHPDDRALLSEIRDMDIGADKRISIKLRIMRRDGRYTPALFNGTLVENAEGEREIYCVIMDISEHEKLLEKLSLEQKKYKILIESSGDIIFSTDWQTKEFSISPIFEEQYGWKVEKQTIYGPLTDILHLLKIHEEDWPQMQIAIAQMLTTKSNISEQVRIRRADGGVCFCKAALYPMMDTQGELVHIIGRIIDIDDEVKERRRLEKKSRMDALSGLLNKEAFYHEAEKYLEDGWKHSSALVFIDVDNFKQINDQLGHMEGDEAIRQTAKRLQIIFSQYDLIARFGGDEFCVLLKDISVETLKEKLAWTVEKLRTQYTAEGGCVASSVSIGAACTSNGEAELEDLLACADKALYQAKEQGKNQYVIYDKVD